MNHDDYISGIVNALGNISNYWMPMPSMSSRNYTTVSSAFNSKDDIRYADMLGFIKEPSFCKPMVKNAFAKIVVEDDTLSQSDMSIDDLLSE